MGVVLKCDWLALTAFYCFNSVYRLLVLLFQSAVKSNSHDHYDILWNDRTLFLFWCNRFFVSRDFSKQTAQGAGRLCGICEAFLLFESGLSV